MGSRRAAILIGAVGAAFGAGATALSSGDPAEVALAAIVGAALGGTQTHPRAASLVALTALLALASLGSLPFMAYPVVCAHAFSLGRGATLRAGLAATAALTGALELGVVLAHEPPVPPLLFPSVGWGAGRALGAREQLAAKLAERARELEEEREAHARLSVRYERARIASELHDIVAHALSVMVVQASAGQRLAARDPQLTAETFEAIADAANQAEQDMGRLVALLSDADAIGPAPDFALVEELVTRAAGSGLHVTLRLEGEREGLPAAVVQAAYRVVQESLTNALRYASGATVRVLVRGEARRLVVEVANSPAIDDYAQLTDIGGGHGLAGLRERVGACGGTLEAGPTPDGGWRVCAQLPQRITTQHDDEHHRADVPTGVSQDRSGSETAQRRLGA
jgi:signal transduction histidine kinase